MKIKLKIIKWLTPVFLLAALQVNAQAALQDFFSVKTINNIQLSTPGNTLFNLNLATAKNELYAFVFLSPECPLCQNYTTTINKLQKQFYQQPVIFIGIIPGKSYSSKEVKSFIHTYKITFPIYIDKDKKLTGYLQANITPEVKLINRQGLLVYSGQIDNWAISLGQQRTMITENYLHDAVKEELSHVPVRIKRTKAVGCIINDI